MLPHMSRCCLASAGACMVLTLHDAPMRASVVRRLVSGPECNRCSADEHGGGFKQGGLRTDLCFPGTCGRLCLPWLLLSAAAVSVFAARLQRPSCQANVCSTSIPFLLPLLFLFLLVSSTLFPFLPVPIPSYPEAFHSFPCTSFPSSQSPPPYFPPLISLCLFFPIPPLTSPYFPHFPLAFTYPRPSGQVLDALKAAWGGEGAFPAAATWTAGAMCQTLLGVTCDASGENILGLPHVPSESPCAIGVPMCHRSPHVPSESPCAIGVPMCHRSPHVPSESPCAIGVPMCHRSPHVPSESPCAIGVPMCHRSPHVPAASFDMSHKHSQCVRRASSFLPVSLIASCPSLVYPVLGSAASAVCAVGAVL
ncbi:unnamed protein product [Closterium sp. NIES-65]|nr:unnamed protein product [Closterium sp. NIES-65]